MNTTDSKMEEIKTLLLLNGFNLLSRTNNGANYAVVKDGVLIGAWSSEDVAWEWVYSIYTKGLEDES